MLMITTVNRKGQVTIPELSNPAETGHPIRFKPATQSGRNRPPNPVDSGHVGLMRLGV